MTRLSILPALLLFAAVSSACTGIPGAQLDHEPSAHVEVRYGVTSLDEDKFEPVEELTGGGLYFEKDGFEFGIFEHREQATVDTPNGPMGMVNPPTRLRSEFTEFSLGYRKDFFADAVWHPFVGIGVAHVRAQFTRLGGTQAFTVDENGFGGYGQIGIRHLSQGYLTFDIGLRGIFASERFELGGAEANFDYAQAYIALGASF